MSLVTLVRHARRAFPQRPYTDPAAVRHLRRAYVRARLILGDRWLLAQKIVRPAPSRRTDTPAEGGTSRLIVRRIERAAKARLFK